MSLRYVSLIMLATLLVFSQSCQPDVEGRAVLSVSRDGLKLNGEKVKVEKHPSFRDVKKWEGNFWDQNLRDVLIESQVDTLTIQTEGNVTYAEFLVAIWNVQQSGVSGIELIIDSERVGHYVLGTGTGPTVFDSSSPDSISDIVQQEEFQFIAYFLSDMKNLLPWFKKLDGAEVSFSFYLAQ